MIFGNSFYTCERIHTLTIIESTRADRSVFDEFRALDDSHVVTLRKEYQTSCRGVSSHFVNGE